MEPFKEKKLKSHIAQIVKRANLKYRKGNAEHGGDLYDLTEYELNENAIDEAIDQLHYLLTLREKLIKRKGGRR